LARFFRPHAASSNQSEKIIASYSTGELLTIHFAFWRCRPQALPLRPVLAHLSERQNRQNAGFHGIFRRPESSMRGLVARQPAHEIPALPPLRWQNVARRTSQSNLACQLVSQPLCLVRHRNTKSSNLSLPQASISLLHNARRAHNPPASLAQLRNIRHSERSEESLFHLHRPAASTAPPSGNIHECRFDR